MYYKALIQAYVQGYLDASGYSPPKPIKLKEQCIQYLCDEAGTSYQYASDVFGFDVLDMIDPEIEQRFDALTLYTR